ncbi:MAG: type II secretion system F family protein [Magnetococcales bacterium]|nr:type II secretion system F family protein [Magnetococcales bacterium]
MPHYYYRAATSKGSIRRGWLKAENEQDLDFRLTNLGLILISHTYSKSGAFSGLRFWAAKTVERKSLILFCIHMEQMLAAGNSIQVALEGAQESTESPQLREVITSMLADILNGVNFSDALESHSPVIPISFSNMVRVGERTGELVEIFQGLGQNLKWEDEIKSKAAQAIRYPAFTGLIILAVGLFMMIFIVPQLMSFLSMMNQDVPLITQALLIVSGFLVNWWWTIFLFPFGFLLTIRFLCKRSPRTHLKIDRLKLKIWFFGPLIYKIFLIRFTNNFAMMYSAGVPILEAINLNVKLSENREIMRRLQSVVSHVSNGRTLSSAFRDAEVFPPPLPKLMEAGEEGGQLSSALLNASYFLDREIQSTVNKIQSMIEPMLTLIMGIMLVWIILSVFLPVYNLVGNNGLLP